MPGPTSLIDQASLALPVLQLYAEDKPISEIQRFLKGKGVELSDQAIYNYIERRVGEPQMAQAIEVARERKRHEFRTMLVQTVQKGADDMKRLVERMMDNYNVQIQTGNLTKDDAAALQAADQALHRWLDRITKLARMPEFASGPSTAIQVNTFNGSEQSLRLMRLLQDTLRHLPVEKQTWLMEELDKLDGSKPQQSHAGAMDAPFTVSTAPETAPS